MAEISLLRLEECPPETRATLDKMSNALGGTYPGELLEALAKYPKFLEAISEPLLELISSHKFEHASVMLRGQCLHEAKKLGIPRGPIHSMFMQSGLPYEVVSQIGHELGSFHYVNPKLLLLAEIMRQSLMGKSPTSAEMVELSEGGTLEPPNHKQEMSLISEEDASPEVKELFDKIKRSNVGLVPREYQAMAKHPQYLRIALSIIEPLKGSNGYQIHCDQIAADCRSLAEQFCDPDMLENAFVKAECSESERQEIRSLVERCCDWMPRHCLNISILWNNIAQEKRLLDRERIAA